MDYLQKNLNILRQRNALLADYIADLEIPQNLSVSKSESGNPTLKGTDNSGHSRYLLSPDDPAIEAKALLKGYSFKGEDGTIIFGFGLGYLVNEIAKIKSPGHVLYVAEGLPEIFKLAMTFTDLSDLLNDDLIFFFIGDSILHITDHFQPIQVKLATGRINKLSLSSLIELCEDKYNEIDRKINWHVRSIRACYDLFNANKMLLLENTFNNIQSLIHSSTLYKLENLIKGLPALVVAAGPSLTKDIELLKKRADKPFIIAVDTALNPLLKNDIRPDLIVTCDFLPMNFNKVAGISKELSSSIPLVYHPESNSDLVNHFNGPKFSANSHSMLSTWLVGVGHNMMPFKIYKTVSHLAFLIARLMGADPIIFLGLDLSFPTDNHHADGCAQIWGVDFENTDFVLLRNNNGGSVKSIPTFETDVHLLEMELRVTAAKCINVSKEGAMIKGTEWMPLERALTLAGENCSVSSRLSFKDRLTGVDHSEPKVLKNKYSNALTWFVSEVEKLNHICQDADKLLNFPGHHDQETKDTNKNIEKLHLAYTSALSHGKLLSILQDLIPRYMISRSKTSVTELSEETSVFKAAYTEEVKLFFHELGPVLPEVLKHSHHALATLQCVP